MIALALLMLTAPQDAPAETAEEIVVIGEKMKQWNAAIRYRDGKAICTIKKSTGDPDVDRIGCDSMTQCFDAMRPRFDSTQDKALDRATRKQRLAEANTDLTACVVEKRGDMIAALAEKRAGAPKE